MFSFFKNKDSKTTDDTQKAPGVEEGEIATIDPDLCANNIEVKEPQEQEREAVVAAEEINNTSLSYHEYKIIQHRSELRCHLISRIPFYSAKRDVQLYELKFSRGNVLQLDALEVKHVYHVLTGYFIRRNIDDFVGKGHRAAICMPICQELIDNIGYFQGSRLCLILRKDEEQKPSVLHNISLLHRHNVSLAIDFEQLKYTQFKTVAHCFNYVIVNKDHLDKNDLASLQSLKQQNRWLQIIAYNVADQEHAYSLFEQGFDLCRLPMMENKDVGKLNYEQKQVFTDMSYIIQELFKQDCNFEQLTKICGKYEFMKQLFLKLIDYLHLNRNELQEGSRRSVTCMQDAVNLLGADEVKRVLTITIGYTLSCGMTINSNYVESQISNIEMFRTALIRAKFFLDLSIIHGSKEEIANAFQAAFFSLSLDVKKQYGVHADTFRTIISRIDQKLLEQGVFKKCLDLIVCFENSDIDTMVELSDDPQLDVLKIIDQYEFALMWATRLLNYLN